MKGLPPRPSPISTPRPARPTSSPPAPARASRWSRARTCKPGTHLDLVGGFTPETRESPTTTAARRSRIFVDRHESAFDGVGDILAPIASGAIKESDVLGDHYDLASGKVKGRLSDTDITFFKNAGGGHLDLMTCETVFARLGKELK